ncbi:hypothetical protein B1992_04695 [Pseudoxanthomonas broegbernensis]|uniref:Uncharacterized protein n=1 Tax=Pseudoxanthomonas broegbernensis TaxID=83619 RepID=A0A7V8K7K2_9GAMM|nr:hypothetical protein [Pseudoxanthomonas broegbernensis]KAF1687282.1 hypothetical protein B1992_04695 [Pseudoxanthomonas broegbernensis]MBB6065723.1 hypothetical protein [Pseudoxanthomonas broegbernensis]
MSLLLLVQQQNNWLTFDRGNVGRSDTRPRLQRAGMVVADFEGAVSSVISLEGSPAHAVALIEKRLRSDGLIDGESKILIHKTRTVGAGYQTLFTAVPLETWQQTYAWAEAQPDHCLLVPATSLLFNALKPGQAVVLQSGRQLSVLAMLKHDVIYRSSLAYSDDPEDLAMTAGALAEQFADDLARGEDNLEPLDVKWCPVLVRRPQEGQPWLDDTLREIFSARSGLQVATVPVRRVLDGNGNEYRTGAAWIESTASAAIAVNPTASRAAYVAEWALPLASAASLVFALVLGALGARWTLSAREAGNRAEQLDAQIAEIETRVDALRNDQAVPDRFPAVLDFVERARTLQQGVDPVSGMTQIREAAANEVRILRVRVEQPIAPGTPVRADANLPDIREPTLRVDGVVDPGRGMPGMQIAGFVERLRRAGFDPVPLDPQGGTGSSRSAGGFFSYLLKRVPPAQGPASGATP